MNRGFAFKQFRVHDDRCQMKVGTDGVLLGAWANVAGARRVLDAGAGSGLISLMIAQRAPTAHVDGVEILVADARQASENIAESPWSDRMVIHQGPLQGFRPPYLYDLIVSNPPYFNRSLLPPEERRASVRHTISLTHDELLKAVTRLLHPDGKFCLILPSQGFDSFVLLSAKVGLHVRRLLEFRTRPGRSVERYVLELSRLPGEAIREQLCLYEREFIGQGRDNWSTEYQKLVADFYI
jgi:tRNA1Val (adenine37-N6)-methyltransferase